MKQKSVSLKNGVALIAIILSSTSVVAGAAPVRCEDLLMPSASTVTVEVSKNEKQRTFRQTLKSRENHSLEVQILVEDSRITLPQVKNVLEHVSALADFVESAGLQFPTNLNIHLDYENLTGIQAMVYGGPNFNSVSGVVRIPLFFKTSATDSRMTERDPSTNIAVQIHEIGHAVLDFNLDTLSQWHRLSEIKKESNQLTLQATALLKKNWQLRQSNFNEGQAKRFKSTWDAVAATASDLNILQEKAVSVELGTSEKVHQQSLSRQLSVQLQRLEDLLKTDLPERSYQQHLKNKVEAGALELRAKKLQAEAELLTAAKIAYDEFWADFTSIMHLKNPSLFSLFGKRTQEERQQAFRNFTRPVFLDDIPDVPLPDSDLKIEVRDTFGSLLVSSSIKGRFAGNQSFDPYLALGAAKFHLYKRWFSKSKFRKNPALLYRGVYLALRQEVERSLNPHEEPRTVRDMNRDLIAALDQFLQSDLKPVIQ